jgi:AmmeMemoRadiSam system protein B
MADDNVRPIPNSRVLIVPHHWHAGGIIARSLRHLAASRSVGSLVLVGPDHRNVGAKQAVSSTGTWSTDYGVVRADTHLLASLTSTGMLALQDDILATEHSVSGLVPALAYYFPGRPVTAVAVRNDTAPEEARVIGTVLGSELLVDPGAVLVVSVDFSHGLNQAQAAERDEEMLAVLADMDERGLGRMGPENSDGRGAMLVAFSALRQLGAPEFVLLEQSDSSRVAGVGGGEVTTYIAALYAVDPTSP